MYMNMQEGWIEVICGSMFAGKTEELIRRINRVKYAKQNILVFKPSIDDRYSEDEVVSHNNSKTKSVNISSAKEVLDHYTEDTDVVVIDEVQFIDDEIVHVCDYLADCGCRVIVAGLDKDFRGEPFPVMSSLLSIAEFVTKLTSICNVCGAPATRTQRLLEGKPASYNDPIVQVGASESYEPRCRHCHEVPDFPRKNYEK